MRRRPLVVGNWKMHKTAVEAAVLLRELVAGSPSRTVTTVVAPPFTALGAAAHELRESHIELGAQTMHERAHGPFTGEISPIMLREFNVRYVVLGHSERRAECGESDAAVARKVRAALDHGITPVVAVGETRAEHDRGETLARVLAQTRAAFALADDAECARCVVAYEPIWAIGTGLVDEPENANAVMGEIRRSRTGLADARMLYGGSMKAENAPALLAQPEIDGGLIGGASLHAASFLAIVDAAAVRASAD